ncbi:MAG: hypothetical protein Q4G63_10010 [Bacteroidia bacterium]|nr:hypothetical protein [Bacteroidia bacterium]
MKDFKIIDDKALEQLKDRRWLHEFNYKAGLEQLRAESMPETLEFIKELTATEDSLKNWVVQQQRKYLADKFIPSDERARVIQSYRDLLDRLEKPVAGLRSLMNSVDVIPDGDSITINWETTEAKQKEKSTIVIDGEKFNEYYSVFYDLIKAHQKLVAFEKSKQYFPESTSLKFHELVAGLGYDYNTRADVTPERFAEIHKSKLAKKK